MKRKIIGNFKIRIKVDNMGIDQSFYLNGSLNCLMDIPENDGLELVEEEDFSALSFTRNGATYEFIFHRDETGFINWSQCFELLVWENDNVTEEVLGGSGYISVQITPTYKHQPTHY